MDLWLENRSTRAESCPSGYGSVTASVTAGGSQLAQDRLMWNFRCFRDAKRGSDFLVPKTFRHYRKDSISRGVSPLGFRGRCSAVAAGSGLPPLERLRDRQNEARYWPRGLRRESRWLRILRKNCINLRAVHRGPTGSGSSIRATMRC